MALRLPQSPRGTGRRRVWRNPANPPSPVVINTTKPDCMMNPTRRVPAIPSGERKTSTCFCSLTASSPVKENCSLIRFAISICTTFCCIIARSNSPRPFVKKRSITLAVTSPIHIKMTMATPVIKPMRNPTFPLIRATGLRDRYRLSTIVAPEKIASRTKNRSSGRSSLATAKTAVSSAIGRMHSMAIGQSTSWGRGGGTVPVVGVAAASTAVSTRKYAGNWICGAPQRGQNIARSSSLVEAAAPRPVSKSGRSAQQRWQVACINPL